MRLRTFHAGTMKEAIAIVRAEMGPDAIIVSSHERPRGRGVEVRAAVDAAPAMRLVETGRLSRAASPQEPPPRPAAPSLSPAPSPAPPSEPPLRGAAQLVRHRVGHKTARRDAGHSREEVLKATLAFHGLSPRRISALLGAVRRIDVADPAEAIAHAFDGRLAFSPLPERPRQPIMLVGDPGAGKTVTIAKLAARAVLAGHAVRVITTDTLRMGAIDQLGKLLALMQVRVATADTVTHLERALREPGADTAPVTLIDTPGTNVLSAGERDDLAGFMKIKGIEAILVQAAGQDPEEAADRARAYADLGVRRLVATRLDATRRLGGLILAAADGPLAIAQVSLSPYLSEPLGALTPIALARILIAQAGPLPSLSDAQRSKP